MLITIIIVIVILILIVIVTAARGLCTGGVSVRMPVGSLLGIMSCIVQVTWRGPSEEE